MARKGHLINSMEELQRVVPSIVKEINANEELALRSANPLLAMEELGYSVTPDLQQKIEE